MEIEIYMPCRPEVVCDIILWVVTVLAIVGLLAFICVVWKEYKSIKKHRKP